MCIHRLRTTVLTALIAVLGVGVLTVPAHAQASDSYLNYLVGQLRRDPVYISSYSSMATPGQAPAITRLIARLPLKTYVVADVAAGPDGQLEDSDVAAVLHDQLGGGLFILARQSSGNASATGFGTSLPVGDAMDAATLELPSGNLGQLIERFDSILLSGETEQRLSADEAAVERSVNGGQASGGWEIPAAVAAGAVAGGGLTATLMTYRRRRRKRRLRAARPVSA